MISIARFVHGIRAFPSDKPRIDPGKWYIDPEES
jgi:hypothetical protein